MACDLHSIKLQAADDRVTKMKDAIKKALEHAHKLAMDDQVMSWLETLRDTHAGTQRLTAPDKNQIREQVDAILGYCGKLAEFNQPDYRS